MIYAQNEIRGRIKRVFAGESINPYLSHPDMDTLSLSHRLLDIAVRAVERDCRREEVRAVERDFKREEVRAVERDSACEGVCDHATRDENSLNKASERIESSCSKEPDRGVDRGESFWNKVLDRCASQGIQGLTIEAVRETPDIPDQILMDWDATVWQMEMDVARYRQKLSKLIAGLQAEGIGVTILKGLPLGECWPDPNLRPIGDFDLWLSDPRKGESYFRSLGEKVTDDIKHSHTSYKGIPVEIHYSLLGSLEADVKVEKKVIDSLGEVPDTRSLPPNVNYIFLTAHLARHFAIYESIQIRQILDLVFLAQAHQDEIDAAFIKDNLKNCGYDRFSDLLSAMVKRYLGIDTLEQFCCGHKISDRHVTRAFSDMMRLKSPLPKRRWASIPVRAWRFFAQSWKYRYLPESLIADHYLKPSILIKG